MSGAGWVRVGAGVTRGGRNPRVVRARRATVSLVMSSITAASIVVHTEAAAPVDPAEQRRPYGSVAPLGSGGVSLLTARVGAAVCMLGSQVELSDQRHC